MKLGLVLCLVIMLVSINIVSVKAQNYGLLPSEQSSHATALQQGLLEQTQAALKQQIQVNQDQHTQDLQITILLISIIAGLSCGIIALSVIFLKTGNRYRKPNPETEHKEDQ